MARTEYVTLNELKGAVSMATAVVDRDALLTTALDAAHDGIDAKCGRRFYLDGAASARDFDPAGRVVEDRGRQVLLVDDIGSLTDLAVATGDTVFTPITWTPRYLPANALVRGRPITALVTATAYWPSDPWTQVRVTARWGWPAVPATIKEATLLQALRLFERRNSPFGVAGAADFGVVRVGKVDPDVADMIQPYERAGFA